MNKRKIIEIYVEENEEEDTCTFSFEKCENSTVADYTLTGLATTFYTWAEESEEMEVTFEAEKIKNIIEILSLCEDELNEGNTETEATLDYEDLISLRSLFNLCQKEISNNIKLKKTITDEKQINKELFEEYNKRVQELLDMKYKIKDKIDEVSDISLAQSCMEYSHKELVEQIVTILQNLLPEGE